MLTPGPTSSDSSVAPEPRTGAGASTGSSEPSTPVEIDRRTGATSRDRSAAVAPGWWPTVTGKPWVGARFTPRTDLEQQSLDVVRGKAFVHNDVRSDNLLTTSSGPPVLVDRAHCCAGAYWLDAAILSVSVAAEGGPSPEAVLDLLGVVVPTDVTSSFVAGWAGYLVQASRPPPTPQTADLRQHQHRKAVAAVRWLSRLIP